MSDLGEKLGVNIDDAAKEAVAIFFQTMNEFEKIAAQKGVSKKDILRAVKHGFNAGLTTVEVKLRSDQEIWLSNMVNELVKCSVIMHAKLLKDNEELSEQSSSEQLTSSLDVGKV